MGGIKCPPIYTRIPREAGCGHMTCWNFGGLSAEPHHLHHQHFHGHSGGGAGGPSAQHAGTSMELKCQECGSAVNLLQGAVIDDSTLAKSFAQVLKKKTDERDDGLWKCSSCSKPAKQEELLFCLKCHPFISKEGAICVPCSAKSDHTKKHGVNGLITYEQAADEEFRSATLRKMYEKKADCLKKFAAAVELLRNNLAEEIGLSHFQNIRSAVFNHFQNPLKRDMERLLLESEIISDTVDEVCDALNEMSGFGEFMPTNKLALLLDKMHYFSCDNKNNRQNAGTTNGDFAHSVPLQNDSRRASTAPMASADSVWEVCASTSREHGPASGTGAGTPRSSSDSGAQISGQTTSSCGTPTPIVCGSKTTSARPKSQLQPHSMPPLTSVKPLSTTDLNQLPFLKTPLLLPQISSKLLDATAPVSEEFPPLSSSAKPQQRQELLTAIRNISVFKHNANAIPTNLSQQLNTCDSDEEKERFAREKAASPPLNESANPWLNRSANPRPNGVNRAASAEVEHSSDVSARLKAAVKVTMGQPPANDCEKPAVYSMPPAPQQNRTSYMNILPPFVWPRSSAISINSLPNSSKHVSHLLQSANDRPQTPTVNDPKVDPEDPQPNTATSNGWAATAPKWLKMSSPNSPELSVENLQAELSVENLQASPSKSPIFNGNVKNFLLDFPSLAAEKRPAARPTHHPLETTKDGAASFWSNRGWSLESS